MRKGVVVFAAVMALMFGGVSGVFAQRALPPGIGVCVGDSQSGNYGLDCFLYGYCLGITQDFVNNVCDPEEDIDFSDGEPSVLESQLASGCVAAAKTCGNLIGGQAETETACVVNFIKAFIKTLVVCEVAGD